MKNRFTVIFAALATFVGCFEPVQGGPRLGWENNDVACSDGRDNDQDGKVDCDDTDCVMRSFCGEIIPLHPPPRIEEDTIATCTDGIDNDEDGQFDCGDRGCQNIQELCCQGEASDSECSDGIDNDGNGFADCADFSCRNGQFVQVCDREFICDDGHDNDDDGLIDSDDIDCRVEWTPADCNDGIDNDNNGVADDDDPQCNPQPESNFCTDGIDNDGDGAIDEIDSDCGTAGIEDTIEECSDGIDNDGNRFTDCSDNNCAKAGTAPQAVFQYCQQWKLDNGENSLERCQDGIDNDGNGFTDCGDFGCTRESRGATPEAVEFCSTGAENSFERCQDGIDNDGNGFMDCEEFSCSGWIVDVDQDTNASEEDKANAVRLSDLCEYSRATCSDGIDNNGNGFTDCNDNSCSRFRFYFDSDRTFFYTNCNESGISTATIVTQTLVDFAEIACSNGIDEDGDGFTDCEDWDCHWNPLLNPRTQDPNSTEATFCELAGERLLCE